MRIRQLVVPVLFAAAIAAQNTWVVGAGGHYLDLQQANDSPAVASGDVLQLVPGVLPHEGFLLTKGLTIQGPAVIQGDWAYRGVFRTWVQATSLGDQVRFVDIDFLAPSATTNAGVDCSGGVIVFDRCRIFGGVFATGCSVSFQNCIVEGNSLRAALDFDSPVTAVGSTFRPGGGGPNHTIGAIYGGFFHASGCQIIGPSIAGTQGAILMLGLVQPLQAWISDSSVSGATAIRCSGPASLQLARTTVTGAQFGTITNNQPLVGASFTPTVPQLGLAWNLAVRGLVNAPVAVVATFGLSPATPQPAFAQPLWRVGSMEFPLAAGTFDTTGTFGVPLLVPNQLELRGLPVYAHAFSAPAGLLRAAPPVGGSIR